MLWKINRRSKNLYMTDTSFLQYHLASMQNDRTVSLQSPNGEQYYSPVDLSDYEYINLTPLEDIQYENGGDLFDVLKSRRTMRLFSKDYQMSFDEFCKYIQFSAGKSFHNDYDWTYRTYPSGGARYPVELYIVPQRVQGLKDLHVYRLDATENRLYDMKQDVTIDMLKACTCASKYDYNEYLDCNIYLFMTSSFKKSSCKYGLLAYRLTLLEAGHIGQNLSLVAERMNLITVPLGGFYETRINDFLGINQFDETTLYFYLIGKKR